MEEESLRTPLRSMWYYDHIHENGFGLSLYTGDAESANNIHHHDYYEIVYYMGADTMKYYYEGHYYYLRKGDIVLCDMFKDHQYFTEKGKDCARISIGVSPSALVHFSHTKANFFRLFVCGQPHYPVYCMDIMKSAVYADIVKQYLALETDSDCYALQHALVHLFLAQIYTDCCHDFTDTDSSMPKLKIIARTLEYIEEHSTEWIRLEELAEAVSYSTGYLSKIFKEVTGESLNQYMLKKKVEIAEYWMTNGLSIIEAAEKSGFDNYSYFYRAFKKSEGIGPREYMQDPKMWQKRNPS